ncbi:MAG: AAA family ATPase [Lachnospiraceae bacterium]|nr:AAA family ATPase [Lachnospiraceae bacterium]
MDIDVKNSFHRLMNICDLETREILLSDIKYFIEFISLQNSEERFKSFCQTYLDEDVDATSINSSGAVAKILCLQTFADDNKRSMVTEFLSTLGKSYLFSRFDRKDISKDCLIEFIGKMGQIMPLQSKKMQNDVQVRETKEEKQSTDVNKDADMEETSFELQENIPEETLEELLEQLHALIGLDSVKREVDQIVNLIRVKNKAKEFGEKQVPLSLHLVFYGNPGTGKTTVARLLAKIYKRLDVLSTGQLIEVDRGGLVGGYVGQTAIKTQGVIDSAMGGVLFIDEAYALTHGKGENDFGQEAVDTILKAMEDKRDQFVVIVAGYPDLMKEFISSNPGLKSRFNQYILFEDYTPEQLCEIFALQCSGHNLIVKDDGMDFVFNHFKNLYENRSDDYANGRDVRNYFENVYKAHANRLGPIIDTVTQEEYRTITLQDLDDAANILESTM